MTDLIYTAICSLDGYVADRDGKFDWAEPDPEVHTFVNDLERDIGTYLYGRRLYEVMVPWEDREALADRPPYVRDYGEIWRSADKVVYSSTLGEPSSARSRIERRFDLDDVRAMKDSAKKDLSVGGATLAAQAIERGVVDEIRLFLTPVSVGGGTSALPTDVRVDLDLVDEQRFGNGTVFVRYRVR